MILFQGAKIIPLWAKCVGEFIEIRHKKIHLPVYWVPLGVCNSETLWLCHSVTLWPIILVSCCIDLRTRLWYQDRLSTVLGDSNCWRRSNKSHPEYLFDTHNVSIFNLNWQMLIFLNFVLFQLDLWSQNSQWNVSKLWLGFSATSLIQGASSRVEIGPYSLQCYQLKRTSPSLLRKYLMR